MSERYSFIIPIATLREKVEKHTSYLGMMRGDEASPNYADRMSLTSGENFLFEDYLKEAAVKTYHWIQAFGRNVPNSYRIFPNGDLVAMKENAGVKVTVGGEDIGAGLKRNMPISEDDFSIITIQTEGDYKKYIIGVDFPDVAITMGDANSVRYKLVLHYKTLADNIFEDRLEEVVEATITEDTTIERQVWNLLISQEVFATSFTEVESVDIIIDNIETDEVVLAKGDYVQYTDANGNTKYGYITKANDMDSVEWLQDDVRDSVVFTVDLPDWQNRNMLPSAQEYLEEAMMNYIMYRWFETTNPREASNYKDKFEGKAREAQFALNAENRVLQRKSKWLQ